MLNIYFLQIRRELHAAKCRDIEINENVQSSMAVE